MTERAALLVGIDQYLDPNPSLVLRAPKQDVAAMERALQLAGYSRESIKTVVASANGSISTETLRHQISDFFEGAQADQDLILYVSGHGIDQGEHRLIIPSDYYLKRPIPPSQMIGDQFIYGEAAKSAARSITVFIDACREGVRFEIVEEKSIGGYEPPRTQAQIRTDVPTVAIVYSCAHGERSHASGGDNSLSFFTQALTDTLASDEQIASLEDVLQATRIRLAALLSNKNLSQTVTPDPRPIKGRAGPSNEVLLRENFAARLRRRIADSQWCKSLAIAPGWQELEQKAPHFAQQIYWMVLGTEELFKRAQQLFPAQRWRDQTAPIRVLHRLRDLLGEAEVLTVPETALVASLPFVYEAVLAAGEILLTREGDPLQPAEHSNPSRAWRAWVSAFSAEESWVTRGELMRAEHHLEAAEDLAVWRLLRFLHLSGEMWEYAPRGAQKPVGWINDSLHTLFDASPILEQRRADEATNLLTGHRLVRLTRLAFGDYEDIETARSAQDRRLDQKLLARVGQEYLTANEPAVAHIANMAFVLAADARRAVPLLAEHIGRPRQITAKFIKESLEELAWHRQGDVLEARFVCPHEAIDLAIEDSIGALNSHRLELNDNEKLPAQWLKALPSHFTDKQVRAKNDALGEPVYRRPHLRFALNQARIREILMGEALYGKPELALREMYQNALDACRYRRARIRYLQKIGNSVGEYTGHIEFEVGLDGKRPFIECRDNGIGMGDRHLRRLFARAGQRFTDSHEFHIERARWEEQDIRLWPNSRFGIGVFSYFMLADELRVDTCRLKEDGQGHEAACRLTAVGSGSLLRLQSITECLPGTTVRLYLRRDRDLTQLLNSILSWLFLPEFDVSLITSATRKTYKAGVATAELAERISWSAPVPESAGDAGQPRLWWYLPTEEPSYRPRGARTKDGWVVLVDGILTEATSSVCLLESVIVNLTENLRPELSVDRTRVTSMHFANRWMADHIRAGAYRELVHDTHYLPTLTRMCHGIPLALYYLDKDLRSGRLSDVRAWIQTRGGRK